MRALLLACLCLMAVALTSCIDGTEEFWLDEKGAGALEITYEIPTSALNLWGGEPKIREALDEWLNGSPHVRREKLEVHTEGDRAHLHVRIAFDSVIKFVELSKSGKSRSGGAFFENFTGVFDVKVKGRQIDFTRTVSPNKALAGGLFIPRKDIEGRSLRYIVHLPVVPLESNAAQIQDGGKTLIWYYSLADGLKKPITTRVVANVPIPSWAIACVVLLGALPLWGLYKLVGRLKRRRRTAG
jgi:hypothetical protein